MEPPLTLTPLDLRDRKVDVLRAVRTPTFAEFDRGTVRGRYTAGRSADRDIPDYIAEPGVEPQRGTETFAEVTLWIDNWRWAGVSFRLRSGKALGVARSEMVLRFREVPHRVFGQAHKPATNVLRKGRKDRAVDLALRQQRGWPRPTIQRQSNTAGGGVRRGAFVNPRGPSVDNSGFPSGGGT